MYRHFESLPAFVKDCKETVDSYYKSNRGQADSWFDDKTWDESADLAIVGAESQVAEAQKLIDQLDTQIDVTSARWVSSPMGVRVSVPAYLAGHPYCMRRRVQVINDLSPVRLWVSTTLSGGLSADNYLTRGTAILALTMALERVRPVEIMLLVEVGGTDKEGTVLSFPLESKPISLAVACYTLTSVSFPRRLTYSWALTHTGFTGSWSKMYGTNRESDYPLDANSPYSQWLRSYIDMAPQDIYIKPAHVRQDIIREPVRWINNVLANLTGD